ncbi:MAG: response regulator transcription factor [Richelia sp. RM2_1_2]|nr:response regulator transcription factor [Richelia sp. SM1_7_0]NJN12111.1 response regulator transcription factor [Richelia sp. RM1_1_1]NJO31060.1 response regulator transcription factor [Richelia sp. SL_2_1]NJO63538.1 response regulator transcription factor [Richelia sp. RM2_1_2]NJS16971.1 response regulator transcription factor [Nostocaceae cyanobacterium CSU_2_110]
MNQDLLNKPSLKFFVVDSQQLCMDGTTKVLRSKYPQAEIITTTNAIDFLNQLSTYKPDLIVMDISITEKPGEIPLINTGIQLLKTIIHNYPQLNIVVQSAYIKTLVRIKSEIDLHSGGFTVADKSISTIEFLQTIEWALQGLTNTKYIAHMNGASQVKPEWLRLLDLAFKEGFQDKAIAQHICVSERMVRHYWQGLQDILSIDCDELKNQGKNLRIITQIRAREVGLID